MMRALLAIALAACLSWSAAAATRVWGLYGWGPNGWSDGVDQIAAQARTIPGVEFVHTYDYRDTQRVADEISASHGARIAIYGYSCGGNSAWIIGSAFAGVRNINEVLGMQPSIWCGGGTNVTLPRNIGYAQNTFSYGTFGLGAQRWHGARRLYEIERPSRHANADNDPAYQNDVLSAIATLAGATRPCDPARHRCHSHTLIIHRTPEGESRFVVLHHGQRP
jgi:hypothetical protein